MKKVIPVLAVLAGAAALVAYKLKKDEEKKIVELDQGLLEDDENIEETDMEEEIEEAPISQPGYMNQMNNEKSEETEEEPSLLTEEEVNALQSVTQQKMDEMLQEGDVHENERPVQHYIEFSNVEDLENFKSKVINQGFVISKGEKDLELVVLHISPIHNEKLMNNILCIVNEAKRNHGKYLGWDSKIIY